MVVGVLRLALLIRGARSLKDKRSALRRIIERVRARYNVSIAEVGDNDIWQRALVGVTAVANDRSFVNITGVKMSPDLREARVFWTVHGEDEVRKDTAQGLSAARGYLRHELSTLGLRVLPELHFTYDEAIDRGDRIERLLREVHEAD